MPVYVAAQASSTTSSGIMTGGVVIVKHFFLVGVITVTAIGGEGVVMRGGYLLIEGEE